MLIRAEDNGQLSTKWHLRFIEMAETVATWSKNPSTKAGAVVVGAHKEILSVGYNGFPRDMVDEQELYEDSEFKQLHMVYAETNACLRAIRNNRGDEKSTLYLTHPPSLNSLGIMKQAGVTACIFKALPPECESHWPRDQTLAHFHRLHIKLYRMGTYLERLA